MGEKLVGVSRPVILPPGFPVMTRFTERLPIAPIPEQLLVTTVGNNVIHNRCFGIASYVFCCLMISFLGLIFIFLEYDDFLRLFFLPTIFTSQDAKFAH